MAQVQAVWNKLNARERLVAIGAGLVILGFVISLLDYGVGGATISLLGSIAVLVIYYLKYSPNQTINWPAPIPTIVLGISAVVALLAALDVLRSLQFLRFGLETWIISLVIVAIGAGLMAWQSWLEYQATQPATAAPAAAPVAAPAAPATEPPAPAPTVDSDQTPSA
jgi:hypothetical protein